MVADLHYYWRKARTMPLKVLLQKLGNKIHWFISDKIARTRDRFKPSFEKTDNCYIPLSTRFLSQTLPRVPESYNATLVLLSRYYLEHRFDLLGSGWVKLRRGMVCRGLGGYCYQSSCSSNPEDDFLGTPNFTESMRIRSLIKSDYQAIDWHIDFKSGYRWDPNIWYRDVPYGHLPGVDIKVPWELSRLQHLPQLALAHTCATRGCKDFEQAEVYVLEFCNQVLDFIASNPPRFGVNWACTMDVAIRVSNLLVAYDMFLASGANFDTEFVSVFTRSIYEHGIHITQNLEWSKELRGNHYLADIAGLLFVSAYLPSSAQTDTWLAFSVQELIEEVGSQFYADGGNFEASTAYHRLSAEMVVYCTALVLGFDKESMNRLAGYDSSLWPHKPQLRSGPIDLYPIFRSTEMSEIFLSPFPSWYLMRIELMAEFTIHTSKPSGQIIQVGDNDSGRFFKITSTYHLKTVRDAVNHYGNLNGYTDLSDSAAFPEEDHLDHRHLVAAINGLFKRKDFDLFCRENDYESSFVSVICRDVIVSDIAMCAKSNHSENKFNKFRKVDLTEFVGMGLVPNEKNFYFESGSLLCGLERFIYEDFGLYIFRSNHMFLAIRAGSVGQNGFGGHAHNDQLSIELQVDGKDIISDPGTFIYTPLPSIRNQYRSIHAHFAPALDGQEPVEFDLGLFRLGNDISGNCLMLGESEIVCQAIGGAGTIIRHVKISEYSITITDYSSANQLITCQKAPVGYSPGYGQVLSL